MGADRRGPLAAFVVVAIIAAILLVTSVRSQAAPSLMAGPRPQHVVVVPPPATSRLWSSVSHHAALVVQDGIVLAHKAAEQTTSEDTATVTSTSTAPATSAEPATAGTAPPAPVPASQPAGHHARPHRHGATQVSDDAVLTHSHTAGSTVSGADRSRRAEQALGQHGGAPTQATDRDHGHHLGWTYHVPALGFGHAWR